MDLELTHSAEQLGRRLGEGGLMLVTAESCTGGWIAKCVTDVPGSSGWLDRGFVTYSNEAKRELLGVAAETLGEHGAVSEPVVREMARGAVARSRAQAAIAVSGIAGPGGGTPIKPVGTVCFCWILGPRVRLETLCLDGDRDAIRRQAVAYALRRMIEMLGGG